MPAPPPSSTWYLVGDGAVGMALAHRLHATGEPVRLVARMPLPDPVELVYRDGDGAPVTWSCPTRHSVNGDESISVKIKIAGSGNFNTIAVPELIIMKH